MKLVSIRQPRNEVARFAIDDLITACGLLQPTAPQMNRLNRACAQLMLARVALFEATWEKYHANTVFVPGNPKWFGAKAHPDFAFKSGSAEKGIEYFLILAVNMRRKLQR